MSQYLAKTEVTFLWADGTACSELLRNAVNALIAEKGPPTHLRLTVDGDELIYLLPASELRKLARRGGKGKSKGGMA